MLNSKKKLLIVLGIFWLLLLTMSTTYAFFNYTRTGETNVLRVGRISFNSTENGTIVLSNVFPTNSSSDTSNAKSMSITVTGDTDYEGGLEYVVSLKEVNLTIGSGTNVKALPIKLEVSVSGNGLGTAETGDYYTAHTSYTTTSKYKIVYDNTRPKNNTRLVVGYIAPNSTLGTASGINGTITLKAYVDSSKVIISDSTTPETTVTLNGEVYTNNTELPQDAIILTTSEWNAITGSGSLSFKIKVESNEGIWLEKPYICKRVTSESDLHKETCTNSDTTSYCQADGYAVDAEITYGNAKNIGTSLAAGDAFDCDVNGNGIIDKTNGVSTERFYYIYDYWNTFTNTFDNTTGVLIYYSNTIGGVASNNNSAYATNAAVTSLGYTCTQSSGCNWYGPVTAVTNLPTIAQWSNIDLKTTTRQILSCSGQNCISSTIGTTGNGANTIMNPFNYGGKAARLLTVPELVKGCRGTINGNTSFATAGSLTACNFLFEGTKYANSSKTTERILTETPNIATAGRDVWKPTATARRVVNTGVTTTDGGARPVIEVPYSMMEY